MDRDEPKDTHAIHAAISDNDRAFDRRLSDKSKGAGSHSEDKRATALLQVVPLYENIGMLLTHCGLQQVRRSVAHGRIKGLRGPVSSTSIQGPLPPVTLLSSPNTCKFYVEEKLHSASVYF